MISFSWILHICDMNGGSVFHVFNYQSSISYCDFSPEFFLAGFNRVHVCSICDATPLIINSSPGETVSDGFIFSNDGDEVPGERSFFKRSVAQFEKDLIMKALRDAAGNRSKAAEMLGIYRRLLYAKIKEYGLEGYPPKSPGR